MSGDISVSDTRALRDAFARYATGVTVVTCASRDGPVAITVNSFTSVSLDPPLILWSIRTASRRHAAFDAARHYAVHVLAADQKDLCAAVSRDGFALAGMPHALDAQGVPILETALARFDCRPHKSVAAGDHTILLGEVLQANFRKGDALAFFAGAYHSLPET